jgi:hypothetical protein
MHSFAAEPRDSERREMSEPAFDLEEYRRLQELPLPVKPGDWVESKYGCKVATVKDVYRESADVVLVDLFIYDRDGNKVGRESPVLGGPRKFEPALDWKDWKRIERPSFPIVLRNIPVGNGKVTIGYASLAKVLPDREWVRPKKRRLVSVPGVVTSNEDYEIEASRLRRAAEALRDASKKHGVAALIQDAEALEAEAEKLSPRFGPKA